MPVHDDRARFVDHVGNVITNGTSRWPNWAIWPVSNPTQGRQSRISEVGGRKDPSNLSVGAVVKAGVGSDWRSKCNSLSGEQRSYDRLLTAGMERPGENNRLGRDP